MKQLIKSTLKRWGLEIRRYPIREPSRLDVFMNLWKQLGMSPSVIIDVGANHGNWTRNVRRYFPEALYLLVEPQERLRVYSSDLLQNANVRWVAAGVSDQAGSLFLTLPPRDDSATFGISVEDADRRGLPQIKVPVLTLNEIVQQHQQIPDMVKIDAEGFDLKALQGASSLFETTDVFLVECSVCCRSYENSVHAVCDFMGSNGYRIFDITDINRSPKHNLLWLSEVVFVREKSDVWTKVDAYE